MKKKTIFFLLVSFLFAYNQIFAQEESTQEPRFIQEDYEIPAHNLYLQDWSADYVVGRELALPFGNNDNLKIILVDGTNAPFALPCEPEKVSSKYGVRNGQPHTGIDLKVALGTPVRCCFDGVVRLVKISPSYGKVVVVRHYNGLETLYGHLDSICVGRNQIVTAGQTIGLAGHTGRAAGDHLHFETRFLYTHFNPAKMVDFETGELFTNILTLTKDDLHVEEEFPEENAISTESSSPSESQFHIVKAGDTLYRIAVNNNTTVEKICRLNNLNESSPLQLGQKIRVR